LQISNSGYPRKVRQWILIQGISPQNNYGVFNNTIDVMARALLERYYNCEVAPGVFETPLQPSKGAFDKMSLFRKRVLKHMPRDFPVASRRQVVEMYYGPKKVLYQNAYERSMGEPCSKEHARLVGFSKFEKTDIGKACRCINPRDPIYNLELARYLKGAEKVYYKSIAKVFGHTTVIKGMNSLETAKILKEKWDQYGSPVAVGLDAKKFDMHVSETALKYEHSFYERVFHSRKLTRLLSWQRRNVGHALCKDGYLRYRINGTRSSGDINTALGNCILMCAMVWTYAKEKGVSCHLANNGDDCVVFMEEDDLNKFVNGLDKWFESVGFRMKVEEPVNSFESLEFCQTNPVFNGTDWLMVRNPKTCMIKDAMCIHSMNGKNALRKWLWAVGECGGALSQGIPVLQSMYRSFRRNGIRSSAKFQEHIFKGEGRWYARRGMKCVDLEVAAAARHSFWVAFGIEPDSQIALEKYFDKLVIGEVGPRVHEHDEMHSMRDYLYYDYEVSNVHLVRS
jgi:hypothetical protein